MIDMLTLNMNRIRQAAITREISTVVSGAGGFYRKWQILEECHRLSGQRSTSSSTKATAADSYRIAYHEQGFDVPTPIDVIVEVAAAPRRRAGSHDRLAAYRRHGAWHAAEDTRRSVSVPVGKAVLGRVINVIGEPVDKMGPIDAKRRDPIHKAAPTMIEQNTNLEMFETGIKVVDLIEPYLKGGKIGCSAALEWERPSSFRN